MKSVLYFAVLLFLLVACKREPLPQPDNQTPPNNQPLLGNPNNNSTTVPEPPPLPNQPFSTWTIGTDSFRTNLVYIRHDKAGTSLKVDAGRSQFFYGSILSMTHHTGNYYFDIGNKTPNPNFLDIAFTCDTMFYVPADSESYMIIHNNQDGSAIMMELPLTRFHYYYDSTNVKWIKGTIRLDE